MSEMALYQADELTKMILGNTPADVACKILGINVDDARYQNVIERCTLKAFSDKCDILTKVSEGYRVSVTSTMDSDRGGFTTKEEEKFFPPDIKALQLLVDLHNGYSPGRMQADREETEKLIVQFVDDIDVVEGEIVYRNEDFL